MMMNDKRFAAELFKQRIRDARARQLAERSVHRLNPAPFTELSTVYDLPGVRVPNLALGIITAPRPGESLLADTIENIRRAGFVQPLEVFAQSEIEDMDGQLPDDPSITLHCDPKGKGVYANWRKAAEYLLANTTADWIMIMEDDIDWCKGAANTMYYTIERIQANVDGIRMHRLGVLSPYTSPAMIPEGKRATGWTEAMFAGGTKGLWGALALCFPRHALQTIVTSKLFLEHKALHAIDYLVGDTLRYQANPPLEIKIHIPSLVEHTGELSTIFSQKTLAAPGLSPLRHGYNYCPNAKWKKKWEGQ